MQNATFSASRRQYTVRVAPYFESWAIDVGAGRYDSGLSLEDARRQAIQLAERMRLTFVGVYDQDGFLTEVISIEQSVRFDAWHARACMAA